LTAAAIQVWNETELHTEVLAAFEVVRPIGGQDPPPDCTAQKQLCEARRSSCRTGCALIGGGVFLVGLDISKDFCVGGPLVCVLGVTGTLVVTGYAVGSCLRRCEGSFEQCMRQAGCGSVFCGGGAEDLSTARAVQRAASP
jgi:hypothetical protein